VLLFYSQNMCFVHPALSHLNQSLFKLLKILKSFCNCFFKLLLHVSRVILVDHYRSFIPISSVCTRKWVLRRSGNCVENLTHPVSTRGYPITCPGSIASFGSRLHEYCNKFHDTANCFLCLTHA